MTRPGGVIYLAGEDFNPHEREARDLDGLEALRAFVILIHTSVKLVT